MFDIERTQGWIGWVVVLSVLGSSCAHSNYSPYRASRIQPIQMEEDKKLPDSMTQKVNGQLQRESLRIAPEDVLDIKIKDQPELGGVAKVDPWGYIKLPYIKEIPVKGMFVTQAEDLIREKYAEFFKTPPEVEVTIVEYNSQVMYVFGSVLKPGRYPLIKGKPSTVRDALLAAELPTVQAALWRVWVVRQTQTGPVYKHVNAYKILYRGRLEENLDLQPGDIVYVPMGIIDSIVNFIGRIFSPITGIGRAAFTAVP